MTTTEKQTTSPRSSRTPSLQLPSPRLRSHLPPSGPLDVPSEGSPLHGDGLRVECVLELMRFVGKAVPLSTLLDEAPKRIARALEADVASIYLREGDGDGLVMRGNVGFTQANCVGRIRLRVGEGLTGLAVATMQPIAAVRAARQPGFRGFPQLDEDLFPAFIAVPIFGSTKAIGALVLQRRGERPFTAPEISLALALTAPISSALRHAQVLDELRDKGRGRTGGGTRKVTLTGVPVVAGRAMGALAALRRPALSARGPRENVTIATRVKRLRAAFDATQRALHALAERADEAGLSSETKFLGSYQLMVADARLRQRACELIREGRSTGEALGTVAREVARNATSATGDPFLAERAEDIEDLCNAVLMLASPDPRAQMPSHCVLLGDQISVFDLLISMRAKPVGVAVTDAAKAPRVHALLELMGVPSITDVAGAFRWATPGDVVVLDADHGFLVINPSRAEVTALRASRRAATQTAKESAAGEA